MTNNVTEFTENLTRTALEEACHSIDLDPTGAILVRLGENAMYRLRSKAVMVRIGRSEEAARKEALVAEWLENHNFCAVRPASHSNQPIITNHGIPVTIWEFIHEGMRPVSSADLGRILRELHALPAPTNFQLPDFSPMPKVEERLRKLPDGLLSSEDVEFLRYRHREITEEFASLEFVLPPGPVHGDAHARNLMRCTNGTIKLIDFEDFCHGPREWDVAVEAVRYRSLGWVSEDDYHSYVAEYGFDVIRWPGFRTLRAARELNMTTWLTQRLGQDAGIDAEVRRRIADLQDDQSTRHWRPL
ncbi:MAG TPA: aminoglycoside phosphotransferase family protein [Pseudonocardiaceae bacterium]|jgi:Ser/Thr protein kinase RdoA (MazF antagonist)|nr:aminoglycoside phosphotransferase family protein [Pseudonocardiaceae bacterium]